MSEICLKISMKIVNTLVLIVYISLKVIQHAKARVSLTAMHVKWRAFVPAWDAAVLRSPKTRGCWSSQDAGGLVPSDSGSINPARASVLIASTWLSITTRGALHVYAGPDGDSEDPTSTTHFNTCPP